MKTYMAKANEVRRKFFVINADNKVLGRLASRAAVVLSGKHKPTFTPHVDTGDYVIVVNADKVHLTGRKSLEKTYKRYSGYPGGLKIIDFGTVMKKRPKEIVRLAIKNMLPKSKLGRKMLKKLRLYTASEKPDLPNKIKEIAV